MPHGPELHESLSALSSLLADVGPFLFVRDPIAWESSGAAAALEQELDSLGGVVFDEQGDMPRLELMQRAAVLAEAEHCRAIVAIGGGTSIDTAKGAAWCLAGGALSTQPSPETPLLPIFAVPTTAGTGSEATHFAVCWHEGRKHSLADPRLLPAHAIVDSNLHQSLSPRLTATAGFDALCQALESLWSRSATNSSGEDATHAARLLLGALEGAVTQPTPELRRAMARGAHLAGRAINVTKTTTPHALSYALTHEHGIPHGYAVALTFPHCLALRNARESAPPGTALVTELLAGTPEAAVARFQELQERCGAPTKLSALGVKESDLDLIATSVDPNRLANDPLDPTAPELLAILRAAL
jgi:alcohol dehydrogenase class IV